MARKPKGIPTGVKLRAPGQWQWRLRIRDIDANGTEPTMDKAVAARVKAEELIRGGTWDDGQRLRRFTLADGLSHHEQHVMPRKRGGDKEASRVRAWKAQEAWQPYPMTSIMPAQIQGWIDERVKAGAAPSTVRNAVAILSSVFEAARKQLHLDIANPCRLVSLPPARPPRHVAISAADTKLLMTECRNGPPYLIHCVLIAIETAMRAKEIRRLHRAHLHETHVHLPLTKNTRGGSDLRPRDVPLTLEGYEVIRGAMEAMPVRNDGWLFGDPAKLGADGGLTESMVSNSYVAAVKRAQSLHGMQQKVTFHDLRHIAITDLAKDHQSAMELAKLTGHKTLRVLHETYYNPKPEEQAAELRRRKAERKAREAKDGNGASA
ncbi:tyrosine-type recombinase/integrase [Asaia sp. VD9]|uniref:tyrosine-type recombinase/integrase n=1 Tax=Asaia sp. VD9 TaxID=3081235 RepID=UPI00301B1500